MKKDLLDELAEKLGCPYLSELRYVNKNSALFKSCINGIKYGLYSVKEWTKAIQYITENYTLSFLSEDEAREYLLNTPKQKLFGNKK